MSAMKPRSLLVLVALVPLLAAGPCVIDITTSDGGTGTTPPPSTIITVRVKNQTDRPLDPQIFAAPVAGGVEHLFDAANQQKHFGVGSTGILTAGDEGTFTLTCGDPVYIGTQGGIFGDDLTAPAGRGQQIVLQEDVNLHCGDIITFLFANDVNTLIVGYGVTPE